MIGSRFVDLILSEIVEELKHGLVDPLLDFEKVLVAAEVCAVLGIHEQDVVILHALFDFHALSVDDGVVLGEEEH